MPSVTECNIYILIYPEHQIYHSLSFICNTEEKGENMSHMMADASLLWPEYCTECPISWTPELRIRYRDLQKFSCVHLF